MRADGWNRIPLVRMTTVSLEPGDWSLDDLIADTERGLYVETNNSWSIDDRRLNFQFACEIGWLIENGEFTRMVKRPNYTGITPQFWASLDAVCSRGPLGGLRPAQLRQGRADAGRSRRTRSLARALPWRPGGGGPMITPSQASEIARRAVSLVSADEAEVARHRRDSSLTRFANNRINQNVAEQNAVGEHPRDARDEGRRRVHEPPGRGVAAQPPPQAAVEAASCAVPDESFPGLPTRSRRARRLPTVPHPRDHGRSAPRSVRRRVEKIVAASASRGLSAAGTVQAAQHVLAVANSNDIDARDGADGRRLDGPLERAGGQHRLGILRRARRRALDAAALGEAGRVARRSVPPTLPTSNPGTLPRRARARGGLGHPRLPGLDGVLGEGGRRRHARS